MNDKKATEHIHTFSVTYPIPYLMYPLVQYIFELPNISENQQIECVKYHRSDILQTVVNIDPVQLSRNCSDKFTISVVLCEVYL